MNYKETLNLPSTKFPMKGNLPNKEPQILKYWESIRLYEMIRKENVNNKKFILHDGPPYANGDIHIGHAVNKVLKDIVIKSKTLSGYDSPYVPGWDCHGLPIELMVEKKHGKSKFLDDKNAFRKACRQYASKQVDRQKEDFIRLGVNADWENSYTSMDKEFEASIIRSLSLILKNNHIYFGSKPVHWCIESESALAEAEVEYQDIVSDAVDVLFEVGNFDDFRKKTSIDKINKKIYFVIWTTTPWTLPANEAIAVKDNIVYSVVAIKDKYIIVAKELIEQLMLKIDEPDYEVIKNTTGDKLIGLNAKHPFYNKFVPVINANHVNTESGTGLVHIAPGHGQDDYIAGIENGLDIFNPVNDKGVYVDSLELFGGIHIRKANEPIISKLIKEKTLLHQEKYSHSYPHCWRFKTPLIFRSTPQWFISMEQNNLRNKIHNTLKDVKWLPEWGYERIKNMIENRPDWCISRQRSWGVPIPFLVNKITGELHKKTPEILLQAADIVAKENIEGWFEYNKEELIDSNLDDYEMVTDTLDVWFDSGSSHLCVMQQRGLGDVADLYLEGSDQHRGWFQSSIITALATIGKAPYKTVLTHGFVVDAQGQKMSKSQGNVISPQEIIKSKGSDILRLWAANTDYSKEMHISDEIINRTAESYRRIRNTLKFLLSNISDNDEKFNDIKDNDLLVLDKWILYKAKNLQNQIIKNYDNYKFHQITQDIQNFCTTYLGGYYLDIIKDRLYTSKKDGVARLAAQSTCIMLLKMINKWIAPILSFTAEEVYQHLSGSKKESVFLEKWDTKNIEISQDEIKICENIFTLKQKVSKELDDARSSDLIGSSLDANVELIVEKELYDSLVIYREELKYIFICSHCDLKQGDKLSITVHKNINNKCDRCWHKNESVGTIKDHPNLCARCHDNIYGDGEKKILA